jgi:hypothetical protein
MQSQVCLTFLFDFHQSRRPLLQATARSAKTAQILSLHLSLATPAFPFLFLALLFFNQQSPPSSQWVTSLSQNVLNYFVDVDTSTLHPLQGRFLQRCGEWRRPRNLQYGKLFRGVFREERMCQNLI